MGARAVQDASGVGGVCLPPRVGARSEAGQGRSRTNYCIFTVFHFHPLYFNFTNFGLVGTGHTQMGSFHLLYIQQRRKKGGVN